MAGDRAIGCSGSEPKTSEVSADLRGLRLRVEDSFVISENPFVDFAIADVVLRNPFVVLRNPFVVSRNLFVISRNLFVVSRNLFVDC
jgi:hypothetical protein